MLRRWVVTTLGVIALVLAATPSVALADPARPGDTRSQVDRLEPDVDGVRFDIVGGDAFLRLRVERGHEVLVPGYGGEPYLRVLPDGTVEENRRSPAVELNRDRYGTSGLVPATSDPDAPPAWRQVAGDGEVLWHDHRVHWMAQVDPPTISPDGLVQRWEVPVAVDGVPVVVHGSLYRVDGPGPVWWLAVLPALGLAAWCVLARRSLLAPAVAAVGLLVLLVLGSGWWSLPGLARPAPLVPLLAALAAVLGVAAMLWRSASVDALLAGAGAALLIVAWVARANVAAGVLPVDGAAWPHRLAVPLALGVGVVALVAGGWPVLRGPSQKNEPQNAAGR